MRQRLPLVLSAAALLISILGATSLGQAALNAAIVKVAQYAKTAGVAKTAKKADVAQKAKKADTATQAKTAKTADTAQSAKTAKTADQAKQADKATEAQTAKHAAVADDATKVAGYEVSSTPEPGKLVPVAGDGKLPLATVDLSNVYSKSEAQALFVKHDARGIAVAGADVTSSGIASSYFNRTGGAAGVDHATGSGKYTVGFPGVTIDDSDLLLATVVGQFGVGEFRVISAKASGGDVVVEIKNQVGNFVDDPFSLVVFDASGSG
jgi:hypothetical protein